MVALKLKFSDTFRRKSMHQSIFCHFYPALRAAGVLETPRTGRRFITGPHKKMSYQIFIISTKFTVNLLQLIRDITSACTERRRLTPSVCGIDPEKQRTNMNLRGLLRGTLLTAGCTPAAGADSSTVNFDHWSDFFFVL